MMRALGLSLLAVSLGGALPAQSQAAAFTGNGSQIDVPASAFTSPTRAMTIEAWVQSLYPPLGLTAIASHSDAAGGEAWYFHVFAPRFIAFLGVVGGQMIGIRTPASPVFAGWTHVAFTYDGQQMALYVNGVQAATRAATGAISGGGALRIGERIGGYGGWVGELDELRIWPFARTQAEIQQSMNDALMLVPNSVSFNLDAAAVDSSQSLVGTATSGVRYVAGAPALGAPVPIGALAYGVPTTGCAMDLMRVGIGSTTRAGNLGFGLYCSESPVSANGGVLLAARALSTPVSLLGFNLYVVPAQLIPFVPAVTTDATGTARLPLALSSTTQIGLTLNAQFVFIDPNCGVGGLVASEGLSFTVQ